MPRSKARNTRIVSILAEKVIALIFPEREITIYITSSHKKRNASIVPRINSLVG